MKKLLFILMVIPFLSIGQTKIRNTQLTSGNQPAGKVLKSDGATNVVWGDDNGGTGHDSLTIAPGSTGYFEVNYPQIFSGQKLIDSLGVMNTNIAGKEPTLTKGNLTAGSSKVTIGGTVTNALIGTGASIDVNEANIVHQNISGSGTNTHAQIDTDLTRLANTSGTNTGDQTLSSIGAAPASGSANYIWNQSATTQNASAKISGKFIVGELPSFGRISVAQDITNLNTHSFDDYSILNPSESYLGYGTFDASTKLNGNRTNNHLIAYQSRLTHNSSGQLDGDYGLSGMLVANSITLGQVIFNHGIFIDKPIISSGAVQNNYGLRIKDQNIATLSNYAIYTGLGEVRFGDNVNATKRVFATSTASGMNDFRAGGLIARDAISEEKYIQIGFVDGYGYIQAIHEGVAYKNLILNANETSGRVGICNTDPQASLDVSGSIIASQSINASSYKLSGVDLFGSLTTGSRTKWDGTKLVDDTDTFITSVSAGNGMNFTTITGTGSVTLGTPSTITASTTNSVTTTSHTHQITGFLPLTGGTLTGAVTSNNSFTGTNFILSSDKRLKQGIRTLTNTDWVERIKFVRYEMKSNPEIERYGVIAQDVEEVNKYLVHTDEYGIKSVSYIDLLVAKIANLEKRISELETKKKRHEK